jgi:hypothetical protein
MEEWRRGATGDTITSSSMGALRKRSTGAIAVCGAVAGCGVIVLSGCVDASAGSSVSSVGGGSAGNDEGLPRANGWIIRGHRVDRRG